MDSASGLVAVPRVAIAQKHPEDWLFVSSRVSPIEEPCLCSLCASGSVATGYKIESGRLALFLSS
jgi:hypothetical protein